MAAAKKDYAPVQASDDDEADSPSSLARVAIGRLSRATLPRVFHRRRTPCTNKPRAPVLTVAAKEIGGVVGPMPGCSMLAAV